MLTVNFKKNKKYIYFYFLNIKIITYQIDLDHSSLPIKFMPKLCTQLGSILFFQPQSYLKTN